MFLTFRTNIRTVFTAFAALTYDRTITAKSTVYAKSFRISTVDAGTAVLTNFIRTVGAFFFTSLTYYCALRAAFAAGAN